MPHLLSKPFRTRAAALKESRAFFPGFGGTDDERALPWGDGFVALASKNASSAAFDVFHGAKGAATRRQLF